MLAGLGGGWVGVLWNSRMVVYLLEFVIIVEGAVCKSIVSVHYLFDKYIN